MMPTRAALWAALCLLCAQVSAQDVTLTSHDGGVQVSGDLLGFDGEFYRIDSIYGELTVDGSGVTCEGPGCPNLVDFVPELRMSGAAAMGEIMMPALVEAFAQRNGYSATRTRTGSTDFEMVLTASEGDNKRVAVFTFGATTTDEGFADLLANEADVVLSMREIRPDEQTLAREAGLGDLSHANRSRVLALDAIVPIVSPNNPIQTLAPQDLSAILAGEIQNWSALGGPNAPIAVHMPDTRTGLGQAVEDRILQPLNMNLVPTVIRHSLNTNLAAAVVDDPFAIGVASYAETGGAKVLPLTGACGFALHAERWTIKTEDYPLTSPMFLYLPARRLPKIGREFLAFLRTPSAQLVIRRAGFVDQTPEAIGVNQQGQRFVNAIKNAGSEISLSELQRLVGSLGRLKRLTTSFRFETGSARLDAQSRSNVQQLARAIEQGRYDSGRLVFVGFSDGQGAASANRDIALKRAEAVRRAVVSAAETADLSRLTLDVDAFGEALPMACDESAWGRKANRRVEVWLQ